MNAERVLLVTGGGSGIGAAVACRAADEGWTVVITGRRVEALHRVAAHSSRIMQVQPCSRLH